MPKSDLLRIEDLSLDLKNFRTIPQKNEIEAIRTMTSISPDRFYGLMASILDDGLFLTENLIILKNDQMTVKEGNRRAAIMKLIHGIYELEQFTIPSNLRDKIKSLNDSWYEENVLIPCTIFEMAESKTVDRIVNLIHGKGEKASRDQWTSVARARHNRDENKKTEYGLDLLEKYLVNGQNVTLKQKERWSGDYPVTVLEEGIRKILERLGFKNFSDLIAKYPMIDLRVGLEDLIHDIGNGVIQFKHIRNLEIDFAHKYDIPLIEQSSEDDENDESDDEGSSNGTSKGKSKKKKTSKTAAATNTSRFVKTLLRKFHPRGDNRQKVVTIRDEMRNLDISKTPLAFCFLLRSIFEISAKAYCKDHEIKIVDKKGNNKKLVDLLHEITNHLTKDEKDKTMVKTLHGALTELAKPKGILSVTSMNQLVHSESFSVIPSDVCTLFGSIFPLLQEMN
ncbi:MAG: hypothetical protein ED557_06415 [Balneola sp.]|nr:MAG: hypothetical protein ED557_06415 [Balneola sp.]